MYYLRKPHNTKCVICNAKIFGKCNIGGYGCQFHDHKGEDYCYYCNEYIDMINHRRGCIVKVKYLTRGLKRQTRKYSILRRIVKKMTEINDGNYGIIYPCREYPF